MFVAKRAFRDASGMIPAGSIVEPAGIKRFKHRVLEGHIVEVTEQNFDKYADFFKQRYGIDLPPLEQPEADKQKDGQSEADKQKDKQPKAKKAASTASAAKPVEIKKVVASTAK